VTGASPGPSTSSPPDGRWRAALWLAVRSAAWAVLVPGVVAGYVPWRYFGVSQVSLRLARPADALGVLTAGLGAVLLGACIAEFARSGRGTLSPVDAPTRLVVRGLYRRVRNPMYLSVSAILLGECLLTRSLALLFYWAVWFAGVNLFVIGYEEPALRRRFGPAYDAYARAVGRWLPRIRSSPLPR